MQLKYWSSQAKVPVNRSVAYNINQYRDMGRLKVQKGNDEAGGRLHESFPVADGGFSGFEGGIYLAFQDRGSCLTIHRVRAYYVGCPEVGCE